MPKIVSPPRGLTEQTPFPEDCASRFEPVRCLASGGFGMVYEATQKDLGRRVAIKLLLADVLEDTEQLERFQNEARVTASLHHPHIVEILDQGAATGIPWIAYEFVAGPSLRARLDAAKDGLDAAAVMEVASQIGSALDAAHAIGALHRDIKPDNILESGPGVQKLTDFGIAKWSSSKGFRTRTGLVLGTPAYMSPEQATGQLLTPSSDIYSMGVLLFELLTGRWPYEDQNPLRLLEMHIRAPIPRITEVRPDLHAGLEVFFQRALAKRPEERWPAASSLAEELERCLQEQPVSTSPRLTRRAPIRGASGTTTVIQEIGPSGPPPRSPVRFAALATGLVVLVALALVRFTRTGPPGVPVSASLASPVPDRFPAESELQDLDKLHARIQNLGAVVAKGSVAEMIISPMNDLGKIRNEGLYCLQKAVQLFEQARREKWTAHIWLYLDEIVSDIFEILGRTEMSVVMSDNLKRLVTRIEEACRAPASDPFESLVASTLPAYTVHVTFAGNVSFAKPAGLLLSAEAQLARLPDQTWDIVDARIRLKIQAVLFTRNVYRSVSDDITLPEKGRTWSEEEVRLRKNLLAYSSKAVTDVTIKAWPPLRRERLLERLIFVAADHTHLLSSGDVEVRDALALARRCCALSDGTAIEAASRETWLKRLTDEAKRIGQAPPCSMPARD